MKPATTEVPKIRPRIRRESFVGMRAGAPVAPRLAEAVWHVWIEGGEPVGPVSADQIARGIRAGKVPSDASVRHDSETFWTDLLDIADVIAALKVVSEESEPPPSESLITPSLLVREFMVWFGDGEPVGPVSADQIARGIRAGKVPADASIQRIGDLFAFDVLDEPDVVAALKYTTAP